MTTIRNLTLDDLLAEGRRWVIARSDFMEGHGYCLDVIVEDHPIHFMLRPAANVPKVGGHILPAVPTVDGHLLPCIAASTDDAEAREAAQSEAESWCEQRLGIDRGSYMGIIWSSISSFQVGQRIQIRNDDPSHFVLANSFGDRLELDKDAATYLHRDLAVALDLPCQGQCPICGKVNEEECCPLGVSWRQGVHWVRSDTNET